MNIRVRAIPALVLCCTASCFAQAPFTYSADSRRCTAFFSGNGSGSTFEVPQTPFAPYQGGADIEADNGVEFWRAACTQLSSLDPASMTMSGEGDAFVTGSGPNTLNAQCLSQFDVRFSCDVDTPYHLVGVIAESGHPNSFADVRLSLVGGPVLHSMVTTTNTTMTVAFDGVLSPGVYSLIVRAQARAVGFPGQTESGHAMCVMTLSTPVTEPCGLDWNKDGTVDSSDFLGFITDFLSGDADFNQDGETNSVDFFEYLERFLGGC